MSDQVRKEELFRKFLDGDLEGEEEREVLHMIADDEEMREMLQFERALYQTAGKEMEPESFAVPEGFTDQVMNKIYAVESDAAGRETEGAGQEILDDPSTGTFQKILKPLITPRQVKLRPVFALAAVLLLALLMAVPYIQQQDQEMIVESEFTGPSAERVAEQEQEIWIRFVYFDEEAESVAVAGDFSDWDPISLNREIVDGLPVWTGLISVPRGEQRYMFVKDGEEWVTDPLAQVQRDDGFGNKNAVINL